MSEALRLAEWVESDMTCEGDAEIVAELRRLHAENEALRADRDNLQIEVLNLKGDRAELVEALLYVNERSSGESVKKDEFERRIADALVKWEASNAAAIRSRNV